MAAHVSTDYDAVVVGAGVVGLACAAALARKRTVLVLERLGGPGRETSSRNSGVIHAGLYYPPGTLKERCCVEGRERLYAYCAARDVAHRKTGKLVLAVDEEERASIEALAARGLAAGAGALELWERPQLRAHDRALSAVCALYSPESGVVDAHGVVTALLADVRARGGDVAFGTEVVGLEARGEAVVVRARTGGEESAVRARLVLNAAGLASDRVAALAGLDPDALGLRLHLCVGRYFALSSDAPRTRTALVYPAPAGPGLGIHLTRDLGGRVTAGPDAEYVDTIDYRVDESLREAFAESVARYLPGLRKEHLTPDYAGVRPKLAGPEAGFRDFALVDGAGHGAPGTLHLIGIESPGLTAALALAERVVALADA